MAREPIPVVNETRFDLLPPHHQRFVNEYLIDLSARAAAIRCGYHPKTGWKLMANPDIVDAIDELREKAAAERGVNGGEFVLGKLWDVAQADPRDLIEIHRVPCRYCWGIKGQFQFTNTEWDRLQKAFEIGKKELPYESIWPRSEADYAYFLMGESGMEFDEQGGKGYTTKRDPNEICGECHGNGIVVHYVADTRKLNHLARQLYRGVKITQNGIEVLMADQDGARNMLARHYNVATERKAVLVAHLDPDQLSDDELIRASAELKTMLLEYDSETDETTIVEQKRAVENRHNLQVSAARARAARFGKTMIKRPRD